MNDGGPAFPQGDPDMCLDGQDVRETQGMTLRDYLAAKAMQGALTGFIMRGEGPASTAELMALAKRSYEASDAMLTERSKP